MEWWKFLSFSAVWKENNSRKIIYLHIIFKQRYICTNGGRLYTDVNNVMTHSMNISKIDRRIRS